MITFLIFLLLGCAGGYVLGALLWGILCVIGYILEFILDTIFSIFD